MSFLLFFFSATVAGLSYTFSDAALELTTVSSDIIISYTSGDACRDIIVRGQQIYHLNTGDVYQSWPKGDFSSYSMVLNVSGVLESTNSYGVSTIGRTVAFSINGLASKIKLVELDS